MSEHRVDEVLKLTLDEVKNESGELVDPTAITLKLRSPKGELKSFTYPAATEGRLVERSAKGDFWAQVEVSEEGVWAYEWQSTAPTFARRGELVVVGDLEEDSELFAVKWRPTTKDVAALIHARTIVPGGNRIGDFTTATEPTGEAVERLIDLAVRSVASQTGVEPCKAPLVADARTAAAYLAAALVEQSYWPEQTKSESSSFSSLMKIGNQTLKSTAERIQAQCGGEEGGDEDGGVLAAGGFDDGFELIGRDWPPGGYW